MILHHITTAPTQGNALLCAISCADKTDTILIAGDAVTALLTEQWQQQLQPFNVLIMVDDVVARGLQNLISANYQRVDYSDFVNLTIEHTKVISW